MRSWVILLALAAIVGAVLLLRPREGDGDAAADESSGAFLGLVTDAAELAQELGQVARKVFSLPDSAAPYAGTIARAEADYGIPESLLGRLLYQESRFRPEIIDGRVSSPVGAQGIAQFMPATAAELGIDPLDPDQAIDGAARYLRRLFDATGDWTQALAAYNWGIGNVTRKGLDAAPKETRDYIAQITADVGV